MNTSPASQNPTTLEALRVALTRLHACRSLSTKDVRSSRLAIAAQMLGSYPWPTRIAALTALDTEGVIDADEFSLILHQMAQSSPVNSMGSRSMPPPAGPRNVRMNFPPRPQHAMARMALMNQQQQRNLPAGPPLAGHQQPLLPRQPEQQPLLPRQPEQQQQPQQPEQQQQPQQDPQPEQEQQPQQDSQPEQRPVGKYDKNWRSYDEPFSQQGQNINPLDVSQYLVNHHPEALCPQGKALKATGANLSRDYLRRYRYFRCTCGGPFSMRVAQWSTTPNVFGKHWTVQVKLRARHQNGEMVAIRGDPQPDDH